ncbi:MAG: hypothetical protein ABI586_07165 [Candidatus Nanopelagicales bacterium]
MKAEPRKASTPAEETPAPEKPADDKKTGPDKSRYLEIVKVPEKTHERLIADMVGEGIASNAWTALRFVKPEFGDVSLTDMVASLRESGTAINRNDMAAAERMLYANVVSLNTIFGELARVSQANMFKNVDAADRYLRLALKAQAQARMTVETLATIKNPPVVFAKQANFAGGPQQVNNGGLAPVHEALRVRKTRPAPNKLLESLDVKRLDARAKGTAGRANQVLAPVAALNRTEKRDR